jgi:transposase
MNIRYVVELTEPERADLKQLIAAAKTLGQKRKRAQILLACDRGMTDETVAAALQCGTSTIYRTKRRFVEEGLHAALSEKPRSGGSRKLTGREEATLVALACSAPPLGRARWTLELLAGELVRLIDHASVSRETVRRRLAENALNLAAQNVVHSESGCRIRGANGRRARLVRRVPQSQTTGHLLR